MPTALTTIAILFSVFCAIRPFRIGKIPFNMATGAVLALLFLMLTATLDLGTITTGIIGHGSLQPWQIIVIFFTVAYISVSADVTGLFDYLAYKIARSAKGSGLRLFVFFYLFACVLTVFTSNDIVILTLTPIIFYLSKHANIRVTPLLFAEFFGANTLSMFLFIGNPTNIIIGNALNIGFLEYTKIMWLPTLVAAISNMVLLFLLFRKRMSTRFSVDGHSTFAVRNWLDAIVSAILLLAMLVTLTLSHRLGLPIWLVTSTYAIIFILLDILFSVFYVLTERRLTPAQRKKGFDVSGIPAQKNEFWIDLSRIPWKILPFIVAVFIFVQALNEQGVIAQFAALLSGASVNMWSSIAVHGVASILLANVINNQAMSILFSNVFVNDAFTLSDTLRQSSAYATIIASNLAANITLIGALAGLMWRKILRNKGIEVSYGEFLKTGALITPIVFVLTLASLYFVFV